MNYKEFSVNFAGSARTKNIDGAFNRSLNWKGRVHWWLLRQFFGSKRQNRRKYSLPAFSKLPPEFIRLDPWEIEYLFAVAQTARRGIVEVGRFNGGSTFVLTCANANVPIRTIDIAPKDDAQLLRYFHDHEVGGNVEIIVGDSQTGAYPDIQGIDLAFIDGDHSAAGCRRDIDNWFPRLVKGGHLLFHDSYLGGEGVQEAVVGFLAERDDVAVVQTPFIGAAYWNYPAGSLAHLVKVR